MEDNQLLEKLKGEKWERISAIEDKNLKEIIMIQDKHTPYMYSEYMNVRFYDTFSDESLIHAYSALNKLGLLKELTIFVVLTSEISKKTTFPDLLHKISQQLGKLKVLKTLQFTLQSYGKQFELIFTDLKRIESLERLKISVEFSGRQHSQQHIEIVQFMQEGYSGLLSRVSQCQSLKVLSLQLSQFQNYQFQDDLKEQIQSFSKLVNLEDLRLFTNNESEDFYDALGYQVSQMPSLKKWRLQLIKSNNQSDEVVKNQGQGLLKISKHLAKSLSFEEFHLDFYQPFSVSEQADNLSQSLRNLSALQNLKSLRLTFSTINSFSEENIQFLDSLSVFTQIKDLYLDFCDNFRTCFVEGVKSLKQLKRYELFVFTKTNPDHKLKKELIKHIRGLKNITYFSFPYNSLYFSDIFRYLPSLVNYTVKIDYVQVSDDINQ